MDEELDIIVTGFDVDQRHAEAGLMGVFGLDAARARRFLRELPVVAKRCGNQASADRYVQALRSIGACVEVQSASSSNVDGKPAPNTISSSLPIPAPSMMARLDESTRVERETLRAIERFRSAEGLDSEVDPSVDVDPINPSIPRAPPLPHDLAKMRNAKLPRWSDRPGWMLSNTLEPSDRAAQSGARSPRPHNDANPPPPPSPVPGDRLGPSPRSGVTPSAAAERTSRSIGGIAPALRGGAMSIRPSTVGLAHAATASVRPGIGLLSWWQIKTADPRRRGLRHYLPAAAALLVAAGTALWLSGALETEADRRDKAWRAHGVDAGVSAPALAWLEATHHEVDGLDKPAARELVERLIRAGARGVHAVRIRASGEAERAHGLLVELPDQATERRTILWHVARARGRTALEPDSGGRYHLLTFQ